MSTLLLDLDDVLCLNRPYGGRMLLSSKPPGDLYERLFHAAAVQTLFSVLDEFSPRVVITSSWLRFLDRPACVQLFERTGLGVVAAQLHEHWDAPQSVGELRLRAIERWLTAHHRGESYVVLDDLESGWSLAGTRHDRAGRIVLCEVDGGLHPGHLPAIRRALLRPPGPQEHK